MSNRARRGRMTDKAQAVLQKMRRRNEKKVLRVFQNPKARNRILDEFNRSTLEAPASWKT